MKHYVKLDKSNTFTELEKSVKTSIYKIKEENYKITLFMLIIKITIKIKQTKENIQKEKH
jgi:hypothetical protein